MLSKFLVAAAVATLAVFATPASAVSCALAGVNVDGHFSGVSDTPGAVNVALPLKLGSTVILSLQADPVQLDPTAVHTTVYVDDKEVTGVEMGSPFTVSEVNSSLEKHNMKVIHQASTTVTITDIDGAQYNKTIASCSYSYYLEFLPPQ